MVLIPRSQAAFNTGKDCCSSRIQSCTSLSMQNVWHGPKRQSTYTPRLRAKAHGTELQWSKSTSDFHGLKYVLTMGTDTFNPLDPSWRYSTDDMMGAEEGQRKRCWDINPSRAHLPGPELFTARADQFLHLPRHIDLVSRCLIQDIGSYLCVAYMVRISIQYKSYNR